MDFGSTAQAPELAVDLGVAASRPDAATVREWAIDKRVFLSSVMGEFRDERRLVAETIEEVGASSVWFEGFGGRDDDPEAAYLAEVSSSDIYLGLVGRVYGRPNPPLGLSATHLEYLEAERRGLRLSVWVADVPDREDLETSFLEDVRQFHVTGSFGGPAELTQGIRRRLSEICAADLSPWAKLGPAIIRASRIDDDGQTIEIRARVVDQAVLAHLESLQGRPTHFSNSPVRITLAGRSDEAVISNVRLSREARRGADVELRATRRAHGNTWMPMAFRTGSHTYSAEELVDVGLRRALFGQPGPTDVTVGVPRIELPLEALAGISTSHDVVSAVVGLLLTEALGTAVPGSSLPMFRLGPAHRGRRRCSIEWQIPARSGASAPLVRRLDGEVVLP